MVTGQQTTGPQAPPGHDKGTEAITHRFGGCPFVSHSSPGCVWRRTRLDSMKRRILDPIGRAYAEQAESRSSSIPHQIIRSVLFLRTLHASLPEGSRWKRSAGICDPESAMVCHFADALEMRTLVCVLLDPFLEGVYKSAP